MSLITSYILYCLCADTGDTTRRPAVQTATSQSQTADGAGSLTHPKEPFSVMTGVNNYSKLGPDRYFCWPMLSADIGPSQIYRYGQMVYQYAPILKQFLRLEKNAWTSDLKWCNFVTLYYISLSQVE